MELGLGPGSDSKAHVIWATFSALLTLACDHCVGIGSGPVTTGSLSLMVLCEWLSQIRKLIGGRIKENCRGVRAPRVCGRKQIPQGIVSGGPPSLSLPPYRSLTGGWAPWP